MLSAGLVAKGMLKHGWPKMHAIAQPLRRTQEQLFLVRRYCWEGQLIVFHVDLSLCWRNIPRCSATFPSRTAYLLRSHFWAQRAGNYLHPLQYRQLQISRQMPLSSHLPSSRCQSEDLRRKAQCEEPQTFAPLTSYSRRGPRWFIGSGPKFVRLSDVVVRTVSSF